MHENIWEREHKAEEIGWITEKCIPVSNKRLSDRNPTLLLITTNIISQSSFHITYRVLIGKLVKISHYDLY